MQNIDIDTAAKAWSALAGYVFVPHTEDEYYRLVETFDDLMFGVGEDESHPLASLMEVVEVLLKKYEAENAPGLTAG